MTISNMTDLLKDEVLELMRGGSLVYDAAGNLVVLTTDIPSGSTYTSVAGFGYSDVITTMLDWSPPTFRKGENATEISFPPVENPADPDAIAYRVNGCAIERATSGETLYSSGMSIGHSYQHGDEAYFPVSAIKVDFAHKPLIIGTDLVNGIYNATLRGQSLNAVGSFDLQFTSNKPQAGVNDILLDIPAIPLVSAAGTWTAPDEASSIFNPVELAAYRFDGLSRAITNIEELRTEVLTKDYPHIGGWRIVTPTGEVWWRGAIDTAKYVYKDAQLKILPNAIVLAI